MDINFQFFGEQTGRHPYANWLDKNDDRLTFKTAEKAQDALDAFKRYAEDITFVSVYNWKIICGASGLAMVQLNDLHDYDYNNGWTIEALGRAFVYSFEDGEHVRWAVHFPVPMYLKR